MGPPGAGKGTQARFVAEHFKIPAISTGDIFRANVTQGTELGVEAKRYMDAGEYVPDEVTNLMVRNRIDERRRRGRLPARRLPAHAGAGRGARRDGRVHRPPARRGHRPHRRPRGDRGAAAAPRGDRGTRGRHRGRHPAPPGGLRRARPSRSSRSTASAGSPTRSTAWARSTRSPRASSTRSTGSSRADPPAWETAREEGSIPSPRHRQHERMRSGAAGHRAVRSGGGRDL